MRNKKCLDCDRKYKLRWCHKHQGYHCKKEHDHLQDNSNTLTNRIGWAITK